MSTHIEGRPNIISGKNIAERVEELDWQRILHDLDVQGSAIIEHLITSAECDTLTQLYPQDRIFRSQVLMAQARIRAWRVQVLQLSASRLN